MHDHATGCGYSRYMGMSAACYSSDLMCGCSLGFASPLELFIIHLLAPTLLTMGSSSVALGLCKAGPGLYCKPDALEAVQVVSVCCQFCTAVDASDAMQSRRLNLAFAAWYCSDLCTYTSMMHPADHITDVVSCFCS